MRFEQFVQRSAEATPAVVITTDFDSTGIGVVRNLAEEGVPVLALAPNPNVAGLRSRYAARRACPDPHYDEDSFIAALVDLASGLPRRAVLFPCQDDAVFATSRRADELKEHYFMPFSSWERMSCLASKEEQVKAAQRAGVGVPVTAFLHSADDVQAAIDTVPFPAVMKSVEHRALQRRDFGKAVHVRRPDDLPGVYEQVRGCGPMMLQDVIPGGDDQLFTLQVYIATDGEPRAQFIRHKIRQHPRAFGVCRLGESLWDQEVADQGLALLREVGFHGTAGVEFKRDPRDGRLKFMEVNARHVSWHRLATALGVNFSLIAYSDMLGKRMTAPVQIDGPRWIWASRDVPDSLREIARGELSPTAWLSSLRGIRVDAMLSLRDPLPGAVDLWECAARAVRHRLRRLR